MQKHCFGSLRFASIYSCTALLKSVWTLTRTSQHLDSFVFQPLCCRSGTVLRSLPYCNDPSFSCQADTLTFDSRIVWYAEKFTVDLVTAGCLSLVAAK